MGQFNNQELFLNFFLDSFWELCGRAHPLEILQKKKNKKNLTINFIWYKIPEKQKGKYANRKNKTLKTE